MPLDFEGGVKSKLLFVVLFKCVVEVPRRKTLRR